MVPRMLFISEGAHNYLADKSVFTAFLTLAHFIYRYNIII